MQVKKLKALVLLSAKQNLAVGLMSLLLLSYAALYPQRASADTNVSGVEIEIVSEPDLTGDPVLNLLTDVDANENIQEDLWARIKEGYAMPNVESSHTPTHQKWYASRPDYIKRMTERSQKYLFHIVEEVQKRGMPTEIALLPMIESAYNPQAYSRSRASGIWQFIPSTGKGYGLKQDWWVDNRRDVTAATNAALDYLQKLHGMFGAWDLALAAYNAGEGTVQRAIDKNRRQGLPTDYQSLSLPPETRHYVPKLQAIKNIITEPEKSGLSIASIPNRPYFARVTTPKQIDAKLAAQLAEISDEEFSALNPSYNRPVIISTGDKHQLLLPILATERFVENLANYDKPLSNWQTYNAKRGERMDNIANKFGINVSQLRNVNGLSASNKLRNTQAMLVPATYQDQSKDNDAQTIDVSDMESNNTVSMTAEDDPKTTRRGIHKVEKGETLQVLADKYGTSTKTLMKINRLKNSKVKIGQNLKIKESGFKTVDYKTRKATNKKTIRNKQKTSRHIHARSHIRLR